MSKSKLFNDGSDEEELTLKTDNEYAKKYDAWREKEERHKLEQKYGSKALDSDGSISSDSDEDDEPPEVSEEMEAQFLTTLALLKNKDPRVYDPSYKFFNEDTAQKVEETKPKPKTLNFADSDDDQSDGDIFTIEKKAPENETDLQTNTSHFDNTKEGKLKEYLTGKADHINADVERDLAPLKALWSDPKLNEGEAFLRDYILNKRYLEEGDAGEAGGRLRDDVDLEADERTVEEQGKFERAYNFRFEEPDDEYLKRYPRTTSYIRPKDERRARRRAHVRTRRQEHRARKMDEIARLKALKLKEIRDKLDKIKEVTGNRDLAFQEGDIEGDFDPEEHDRRMRALFDEQYYDEPDDQKPVFPDLDEELEIENWDKYEAEQEREGQSRADDGPHCEDADFNMDADYEPKQARASLLEELQSNMGTKKRNRRKRTKLAKLLAADKPKFLPTSAHKTYAEHMEEYYGLDCEDVIGGDLPTRFKYRQVLPNDYGLAVEEILLADDKELTQWVPLKKIVKHKPTSVEKGEVVTYAQKAQDTKLKRRILPSLFKDLPEQPELVAAAEQANKKKRKKKNKNKEQDDIESKKNENDEVNNAESAAVKREKGTDILEFNPRQTVEYKERNKKQKVTEAESAVNEDESSTFKKKKKKHKKYDLYRDKADDSKEGKAHNSLQIHEEINKTSIDKPKQSAHKSFDINSEENIRNKAEKKKRHKQKAVTATVTAEQDDEKKKHKNVDFVIEDVNNELPSNKNPQNNLKRKLQTNTGDVPIKKRKDKHKKDKNKANSQGNKQFKNKFTQNNKTNEKNNALGKLSDERLKAYGLNPKKYRGFLKYKKF